MPKVLVIDDMQENLFVISALIRNLIPEYEVLTAQSGFLGMQIALDELPDTVLLDIVMPEMDGFEVCKASSRVREQRIYRSSCLRRSAQTLKAEPRR